MRSSTRTTSRSLSQVCGYNTVSLSCILKSHFRAIQSSQISEDLTLSSHRSVNPSYTPFSIQISSLLLHLSLARRRASFSSDLRDAERPCWRRPWRKSPARLSSTSPPRSLLTSGTASQINSWRACLALHARRSHPSSLLTKLIPS